MSKNKAYFLPAEYQTKENLEIVMAHFEHETDVEEKKFEQEQKAINHRIKQEKYARKLCMLRTLSFPLDLTVGTAMFGIEFLKRRVKLQADMFRFIFKKITYKQIIKSIETYA